jgi:hypothetical protein
MRRRALHAGGADDSEDTGVDEPRVEPGVTSWEALPGRALEVLARACGARAGLGGRPGRAPEPPTVESVERLIAGATTLAAALGRTASARSGAVPLDPPGELRRVVELLAELGEAARRVAAAAGAVGQEPAAEVADSVMCVALTLRILAELVLRTVPPADADGRPAR